MKATTISNEPNNPADVAVVSPNPWRTRVRATSNLARKYCLATIAFAISISVSSAYFAYRSKSISLKSLDTQSRNDRPAIAIISADVEGFGSEKISLSLQLKNVEPKTAYSLAIIVVGFDRRTEKAQQLAHIAGTDPIRHDTSFTQSTFIKRTEMLPIVVLCLLYADEDKQGFSEHVYYDAPEASKISGRMELIKLAPEPSKRVDNLNICRM